MHLKIVDSQTFLVTLTSTEVFPTKEINGFVFNETYKLIHQLGCHGCSLPKINGKIFKDQGNLIYIQFRVFQAKYKLFSKEIKAKCWGISG